MSSIKRVRPNGHIWMAAEQFCNAAESLFQSEDPNRLVYPIVVNYALSVELALKSTVGAVEVKPPTKDGLILAAKTASDAWGHKLDSEVFANLPGPIRAELETEFKAATSEELLPLLKKCNDYFVHARYPYEQRGGSYDLSGLRTLALGALKATRNLGLKSEGLPTSL